jgi:hypothetical protein
MFHLHRGQVIAPRQVCTPKGSPAELTGSGKVASRLSNSAFKRALSLFVLAVLILILPQAASAQLNASEFDLKYSKKPYHFGISLGYNFSDYKVRHSEDFLQHDSILVAESATGPGFNLGIIANLRLGKNFDLRLIPSLTFAEKQLQYEMIENATANRKIESINMEIPLMLKYKSNPLGDFRMYVIGGVKYAYDLASNATARNAEEQVKVSRSDLLAEAGIGMEFYFPYFIFSPEIKFSHGLINVHAPDEKLQFSRVLGELLSRMITISIHFEG